MRKLSLILIGLVLSVLLSGCGKEPDKTFLVSAICFENDNGNIVATAEYISVSDTDAKSGYTAKTANALGERVSFAVSRLSADLTKSLNFEHCAVVMLGDNLTVLQTSEIFEFLKNGEISFSAKLVCVENPDVLNAKTDSNPSTGYALSSLLESRGENFGYGIHIKMYEIFTARKQTENIFALPFVTLRDEKLSADGMMLYIDDVGAIKLGMKESIYYAMARNIYEGGRIEIKDRVETLSPTKLKEIKTEDQTLILKTNIKDTEIVKELEDFSNRMLNKGVNLFSKKDFKNIVIKGEALN